MAEGKASVPQVKAWFAAGDNGKTVTARDLIDLKKAPGAEANPAQGYAGSGYDSAYDDLAFGIGNGSLTY